MSIAHHIRPPCLVCCVSIYPDPCLKPSSIDPGRSLSLFGQPQKKHWIHNGWLLTHELSTRYTPWQQTAPGANYTRSTQHYYQVEALDQVGRVDVWRQMGLVLVKGRPQ